MRNHTSHLERELLPRPKDLGLGKPAILNTHGDLRQVRQSGAVSQERRGQQQEQAVCRKYTGGVRGCCAGCVSRLRGSPGPCLRLRAEKKTRSSTFHGNPLLKKCRLRIYITYSYNSLTTASTHAHSNNPNDGGRTRGEDGQLVLRWAV